MFVSYHLEDTTGPGGAGRHFLKFLGHFATKQQKQQISNASLRASPTVSAELKFPLELNSFSDAENEFNSTGSFNSKGTVGDARRLSNAGNVELVWFRGLLPWVPEPKNN